MQSLLPIAEQFVGAVIEISPLGNGLINDTYLVKTPSSSFVLQRVNRIVFPAPELIMSNLAALNRHIAQKAGTTVKLQIPAIINTADGGTLYHDQNGDVWRALSYIADSISMDTINTVGDAEQVGFALGHFHRLTSDINPALLHDTLPGFHITPRYLNHYHQLDRQIDDEYCSAFIANHQHIVNDLESPKQQGLLTMRVIHGDPKLNNFLFDRYSKKTIGLIDLDTVKPGLVHYDIGDCVRSCCNTGFDAAICRALLKSYLTEAGAFFTEYDYRYLYAAIRLIPFELGIRFYTDYLEGNRYFRVTDPKQNLQRAIRQFELCANIIAQEPTIKSLIMELQSNAV